MIEESQRQDCYFGLISSTFSRTIMVKDSLTCPPSYRGKKGVSCLRTCILPIIFIQNLAGLDIGLGTHDMPAIIKVIPNPKETV